MRTGAGEAASPRRVLREIASHTAITFLSTMAIQATTFAILALAGLVLPVGEFARLSLIVAAVMMASALFELGLNITSTKMFGDTHDEGYLHAAFLVRLGLAPLGAVIGAAVALAGLSDIGLGIGLGALLNIWNGMRATDQARQDYRSFTRSSLVFAVCRAVAGLAALFVLRDAALVAVAVYALPMVACAVSDSARFAWQAFSAPRPRLAGVFRYAAYVYVNAVTFIAIPYIPQFFVASRLDAADVGAYGLILTFTGPVSLVVYSLRSVLLPKMLGSDSHLEDMLWSRKGFAVVMWFAVAMALGGAIVGVGLEAVYAQRFPQILPAFLIFFTGYAATSAVGFYSLSVHTKGVPGLACWIGIFKLMTLAPALSLCGSSLPAIVFATAAVMLGFEILLALLLMRTRSP